LKVGDKKLDKIDESYLPSDKRMGTNEETPLCAKAYEADGDEEMSESAFDNGPEEAKSSNPKDSLVFPKEYGTITEFYFMLAETVHYGLIPIVKKAEDIIKIFERLLEEKKRVHEGHPEYQQMKAEFENMQLFRLIYEITLFDKTLIKEVNNLFKVQLEMIKRWGSLNKETYSLFQKPPTDIMRLMPEHFLTDMTDLYHFVLKHSRAALKFFSPEDVVTIFETTIVSLYYSQSLFR
jgi:hypothetical protein